VETIKENGNSVDFFISIPQEQRRFLVPKGSVTVDGVSLTLNETTKTGFRLTIIPHTLKESLFGSYSTGHRVNIETDMFARYIYHLFNPEKKESLSWDQVDKISALY
jgi:riboflavin synthase